MNNTITWEVLAGVATDTKPAQQAYQIKRITHSERMYTPPPATVTLPPPPADLDLQRLNDSAANLPEGLRMEFKLKIAGTPEAFYITKNGTPQTHWALFAMHADPLYGNFRMRQMPKHALRWCGRAPWATMFMIAHEVPAWASRSYGDPKNLPHATFVSDISELAPATIDPILYGVQVAGNWWGFVPLAEWRL